MNIFIDETQKKLIKESLMREESMNNLPLHIEKAPLADIIGTDALSKMVSNGFTHSVTNFSDNIEGIDVQTVLNESNRLRAHCKKLEKPIKNQLEKLCYDILSDLFHFPSDEIHMEFHLTESISPTQEFHTKPDTDEDFEYDDVAQINSSNDSVKKRKVINSLIEGASLSLADICLKKYVSDIFELDETLPHIYSKLFKLDEYLLYKVPTHITDKEHHQEGYSVVYLSSENTQTKLVANGTSFYILLTEAIRGFLEISASFGLPDDLKIAKMVINQADALEYEPWSMRYGRELWKMFTPSEGELSSKYIPSYISNLSSIDNTEFLDMTNEIVHKTKKGKSILNQIYAYSVHENDYSDFEDRITKKNDDTLITDDEYFGSDDIIDEATYPDSFNLELFKSLPSFRQRIAYCEQNLQRISSGSARIVYKIDDNTVLKLAKNKKGVAQNEVEGGDRYKLSIGCFAEVYAVDDNFLWLEMQLARKAKPTDFLRITGKTFGFMQNFLDFIKSYYSNQVYMSQKVRDVFLEFVESEEYEYSLFNQIEEYLSNYQLRTIGDLKRISSWGVVTEDGEDKLVIIDFGLNDEVYNDFYRRKWE